MQKLILLASACIFLACNSGEQKEASQATGTDMDYKPDMHGYSPTYSASFEMGSHKNTEAVLAVWKSWDDGNLMLASDKFADSVRLYVADGSLIDNVRDSIIAFAQSFRDMFSGMKSTVHAILPFNSTDKNEQWVSIWGTEVRTDKSGKIDSTHLQETWRFNKDGKIDRLYQYERKPLVKP